MTLRDYAIDDKESTFRFLWKGMRKDIDPLDLFEMQKAAREEFPMMQPWYRAEGEQPNGGAHFDDIEAWFRSKGLRGFVLQYGGGGQIVLVPREDRK